MRQSKLIDLLKGFAMVLPVAWFPVLFVYLRNSAEASISQVWLPLGIFTAVAMIFFLFFSLAARHFVAGGITAMAAMLLTAFWRPLEDAARNVYWSLHYWHLIPLAMVGCFVLAVVLSKIAFSWPDSLVRIRVGLCSIFSILIVYNVAMATPVLLKKVQTAETASSAGVTKTIREDFPNVYFIILDEYAPFQMMEKYYGYVPKEFEKFLEKHNFNISLTSRNQYFYTSEVLAGLIGMKPPQEYTRFTVAADGRLDKLVFCPKSQEGIIAESRLMRFFKQRGYTIYAGSMLGDIYNIRTPLFCDACFKLPTDQQGRSFDNTVTSVLLERSALAPLEFLLPVDIHYYNRMVEGMLNWIQDSTSKVSPRFLWAHLTCPHAPYMFKKDGSWRQERGNETDPVYYLEQYQYVTTRITEVLASLLANDPDCVILLMSDHSARQNMTLPVKDMSRIFNAVYYRGKKLDIEGLSGLDTELLVLNHLFGADFPVSREQRPLAGVVP